MDIIFLSSSKGRFFSLAFNHPIHYVVGVLAIVLIISVSAFLGYRFGTSPDYREEITTWKVELEQQKQTLAHLQKETDANIDVLSSRIGLIQAHAMRLDALGRRLMSVSNLKGEFNFEEIPALGGPAQGVESSEDQLQLSDSIKQLSLRLQSREEQLLILEDLMLYNISANDVYPAGRPIQKGWLSSYYGMRTHPISGKKEMHKGIDFAGKFGDPVVSVAKGIVAFAGKKYGYGQVVDIEHGNGYVTRYAHNSKIVVAVGDRVDKGTQIAEIGTSGRSTGPHVHFEVIKNGHQINPIKFIRAAK